VGQRSPTDTVAGILQAFLLQRTWSQAELARRLELSAPATRKRLVELQAAGVPLERQEDHPHVYWSVPKGWFPGGLLFERDEVPELLRLLGRLPRSRSRERLLRTIVSRIQDAPGLARDAVVTPEANPREEAHLATIEDAARSRVPLRFTYYAASTGKETVRHASVHRVFPGPPARFVATCHKSGTLKWFRVGGVSEASLDPPTGFRMEPEDAVEAFVGESLGGFHDAGRPETLSFRVRDPEARWVARNLLEGMRAEDDGDGIRVTVRTASTSLVARYVVALGEAAAPETESLARAVEAIASGALAAARRARASAAE
jgi:predicted DNA-binding transcriptional regulator YafY